MREKLTSEEYKKIMSMKPEERTSDFGNEVTNKIIGILIAYSKNYDIRDGWIDIMTTRDAEKEIKQLIVDCGGILESPKTLEIERLEKESNDRRRSYLDNLIEKELIERKIKKLKDEILDS